MIRWRQKRWRVETSIHIAGPLEGSNRDIESTRHVVHLSVTCRDWTHSAGRLCTEGTVALEVP